MSVERTGRRGAARDLIGPDDAGPESAAALLIQLMPTIQRVAVAAMRQAPHTAGMTLPQFRILGRLSERAYRAGELAEALEIGPATLTVTADTLERRGLIARSRGLPADRRAVTLRLTPAGQALFPALKAKAVSGLSRLLDQSEPAECESLIVGLESLQRGLRGLCAEARADLEAPTPGGLAQVEKRAHGRVEEDA